MSSSDPPNNRPKVGQWLPMYNETNEPLASLQSCPINLLPMCNFHVTQKYKAYQEEWSNPAPVHCRRGGTNRPPPPVIHSDRLGVEIKCEAFA